MNILGWQLRFRRTRRERTSPFTAVLPKVRGMREKGDWPSVTPAGAAEQKRHRMLAAVRRITYQPTPSQWTAGATGEPWTWWLWPRGAGLLVLLAAFVTAGLLLTWQNEEATLRQGQDARLKGNLYYQHYDSAPPFLSDSMAVSAAVEMLARSGLDPNQWTALPVTNRNDRLAPDGSRDTYLLRTDANGGFITFKTQTSGKREVIASLLLQSNQLSIMISPPRTKP